MIWCEASKLEAPKLNYLQKQVYPKLDVAVLKLINELLKNGELEKYNIKMLERCYQDLQVQKEKIRKKKIQDNGSEWNSQSDEDMQDLADKITAFELQHSEQIGNFFEFAQDKERILKIIQNEEQLNKLRTQFDNKSNQDQKQDQQQDQKQDQQQDQKQQQQSDNQQKQEVDKEKNESQLNQRKESNLNQTNQDSESEDDDSEEESKFDPVLFLANELKKLSEKQQK